MFALIAAVIAIIAIFAGSFHLMLWLFLAAIALHFAFGWGPITQPWTRRQ